MFLRIAQNSLTVGWYLLVITALYFGWSVRDYRYLIPESGVGYWLGILGGSMMLLLLLYPLIKRNPRWKYIGSVKFWFRFHMFLGIAGPALIVFHSGYRLGSLNGAIAFISMLIVAASGLIGRYLYRRIHHGLYGEKISFDELFIQHEIHQQKVEALKKQHADLIDQLQAIEQKLVNRHTGENRSLWLYLGVKRQLATLRRRIRSAKLAREDRKLLLKRIKKLLSIVQLGKHEILFSYWHILHLPLFVMLVISGITHVVVVHFY